MGFAALHCILLLLTKGMQSVSHAHHQPHPPVLNMWLVSLSVMQSCRLQSCMMQKEPDVELQLSMLRKVNDSNAVTYAVMQ